MFLSQVKRFPRFWGFLLLGLGIVLLGISAAYWGYGLYTRSQLHRLEVRVPLTVPIFVPAAEGASRQTPAAGEEAEEPPAVVSPLPAATEEGEGTAAPGETEGSPAPESPATEPEEPAASIIPAVPQDTSHLLEMPPELPWIRIPDIEVDSRIVEIGYSYEDGKLVWERPKHVVGHLEGTANPGEIGNSVLAGHLQSPIRHEGSVFRRLPEIADLLKAQQEGDREPVDITIFTQVGPFPYRAVYRVVETKVVSPQATEEMLNAAPDPTLTLITCWPEWIYSDRFVVKAKLIDAALLPQEPN